MNTQLQKLLRSATNILLTIMMLFTFSLASLLSVPSMAFAQEYEAEDASLSPGFIIATNNSGFSGTGFVDYVGEGYVEWLVDAAQSGTFLLSFRYALRTGDRPLDIVVNGAFSSPNTSFPATGAWDNWGVVETEVMLNAGTNTVRAQTLGVSGPNMDKLDVNKVVTPPSDRFVDNGDGTITDNETGLMWEKKLASDGSDGGNCAELNQADRNVHCVNNYYPWTDTADGDYTNPDGTAFTDFLARLNEDTFLGFDGTCFANHCDWHMPRLSELQRLALNVDECISNGSCVDPILGPTAFGYWSFTSLGRTGSAWGIYPYLYHPGTTDGFFADYKTITAAVRAVRRAW